MNMVLNCFPGILALGEPATVEVAVGHAIAVTAAAAPARPAGRRLRPRRLRVGRLPFPVRGLRWLRWVARRRNLLDILERERKSESQGQLLMINE